MRYVYININLLEGGAKPFKNILKPLINYYSALGN